MPLPVSRSVPKPPEESRGGPINPFRRGLRPIWLPKWCRWGIYT
jgi:hypothetical protein